MDCLVRTFDNRSVPIGADAPRQRTSFNYRLSGSTDDEGARALERWRNDVRCRLRRRRKRGHGFARVYVIAG